MAIKVLADNWGHDDAVRHRFLEEGRFLRRVESEHIVQVHDVGELEDGRPFLVLTYADRGTLADRLKKEPLPVAEAVDVVVQVGRGLQALHRRGLLHRDVKPANVLFRSTDDGERAVLSDLGLGKSLDEVSRITMPGGTPSYVAPEQAMGERLDQRADQYSLGAVAYAALTGRSPHQVDGLGAASRVEAAPPPSSLGFDLPNLIDATIVRALDPDREKRWPDVATFTRELVGALDETTHDFPLSIRESVTVAVPASAEEAGEQTALSDANQPTLVKASTATVSPQTPVRRLPTASRPWQRPSSPRPQSLPVPRRRLGPRRPGLGRAGPQTAGPQTAGARTAGAETAGDGTAGLGTGELETAAPRKRRRGRWVIAAVLALIVGGGAGYEGQRYLVAREQVPVAYKGISVTLPRAWAKSVSESQWKPPGSTKSYPALRVSEDPTWSAYTPGVFVGVTDARDVKLTFGDGIGQCSRGGDPSSSSVPGRTVTDQFSTGCGNGDGMLLQRVVDTGATGSMLIQVLLPTNEPDRAREIAESVTYAG